MIPKAINVIESGWRKSSEVPPPKELRTILASWCGGVYTTHWSDEQGRWILDTAEDMKTDPDYWMPMPPLPNETP